MIFENIRIVFIFQNMNDTYEPIGTIDNDNRQ